MKQFLSFIILSVFVLQIGTANDPFQKDPITTIYSIQLMASQNPQVTQFQAIKEIGYIFSEKAGKFQRIFLGKFEDLNQANTKLAQVKSLGFGDAFLSKRIIDPADMVYTVQLQTYGAEQPIEWDKWRAYENLYVNLAGDGKIKLMAGTFNDIKSVNEELQAIRAKGVKGAFIKHINTAFIHKSSIFEMEVSEGSRNQKMTIKGELYLPKPSEMPVAYEEFNKTSRKSVKELQGLLANNSNFNGNIDGVYDINTEDAMSMFEVKNNRYLAYVERAENMEDDGKKAIGLQFYVNEVYNNPLMAYGGLKEVTHPMSDVYLAYMYFSGKANAKGQDKQTLVNNLMNGAVQKTFVTSGYKGTTKLDYTKTYNYADAALIIEHLGYMQDALQNPPSLPCWLFEEHPKETASIFNNLYSMVSGCGDFMDWKELKVLKTIASDLDPIDHTVNADADENVRMAYDARRAQLYLAPTVSEDEASVMDSWNTRFWKGMNTWKDSDPLHKRMVLPLEMAYFQALVKLENHYLGRGFTEDESRILGLSVMRTVVNYHLQSYVK
jgi:hypothetical protein